MASLAAAVATGILAAACDLPQQAAIENCSSQRTEHECAAQADCRWCFSEFTGDCSFRKNGTEVCSYIGTQCNQQVCSKQDPFDDDVQIQVSMQFRLGACPVLTMRPDDSSCLNEFSGGYKTWKPDGHYTDPLMNSPHCMPLYAIGCNCEPPGCGSGRGAWCNGYTEKCVTAHRAEFLWASRTHSPEVCCKNCYMTPRAAALIVVCPLFLTLGAVWLLVAGVLRLRQAQFVTHRRYSPFGVLEVPSARAMLVICLCAVLWLFSLFLLYSMAIVCGAAGLIHSYFTLLAHTDRAQHRTLWSAVFTGALALTALWGWGAGAAGSIEAASDADSCNAFYDSYFQYDPDVEGPGYNEAHSSWGYCGRGWLAAVLVFRVFALFVTFVLTAHTGYSLAAPVQTIEVDDPEYTPSQAPLRLPESAPWETKNLLGEQSFAAATQRPE